MYVSNQERLKRYRKERNAEEVYEDEQQDRLYEQIAIEHGLEAQATTLANLARSVIRKGADILDKGAPATTVEGVVKKSGFNILSEAIKNGKLDELVKRVIGIPNTNLTKKQRIIKKDLQNPDFKDTVNRVIDEALDKASSPEEMAKVLVTTFGGKGNESDVDDLIDKASIHGSTGYSKLDVIKQIEELGTMDQLNNWLKANNIQNFKPAYKPASSKHTNPRKDIELSKAKLIREIEENIIPIR